MLTILNTTTILLIISSFGLGIFSFSKDPKAKTVRLWFLTSMAIVVWASGYFLTNNSHDPAIAYYFLKIIYIGATLIPILFFHFVCSFLFKDQKYKNLIYVGYALATIFLILNTLTSYIISGIRFMENFGSYEEIATPGFYAFLVYFFFFVLMAIGLLISGYKNNGGVRRKQIFFILLAALVGFVGGASNFLTDLTGIYPYGQIIVWLYPLLVTYGIYVDEFQIKIKF